MSGPHMTDNMNEPTFDASKLSGQQKERLLIHMLNFPTEDIIKSPDEQIEDLEAVLTNPLNLNKTVAAILADEIKGTVRMHRQQHEEVLEHEDEAEYYADRIKEGERLLEVLEAMAKGE